MEKMATSEERIGLDDVSTSSDYKDTSEKLTAARDENCPEVIHDDQQDIDIEKPDSDHIKTSLKRNNDIEGNEIACSEFSKKTWKNDLTVIVDGKHLYVSSSVLALISQVFSSMLEAVFKEEGPRTLQLTDIYDDFVEFLKCIYPGIMKPITKENALTIFPLAHKYQVEYVEETCKTYLLCGVNGSSTLESLTSLLNIASTCHLTSLRDKCIAEMSKRKLPDSELYQLDISPEVRQKLKTAEINYLKEEVQTLQQRLQRKSDRCEELEYLVTKTWCEDLKITYSANLELHLINVNVSEYWGCASDHVGFKNMTWQLETQISRNTGFRGTNTKELSVVLAAKGDASWRQWKCKVKASCSVYDGTQRAWKDTSEIIETSKPQLSFTFSQLSATGLNWTKPLKVSLIFAVGSILM